MVFGQTEHYLLIEEKCFSGETPDFQGSVFFSFTMGKFSSAPIVGAEAFIKSNHPCNYLVKICLCHMHLFQ